MRNIFPTFNIEPLYAVYFWLTSKRPIGALDWKLRRALGAWKGSGAGRRDMAMINALAGHRQQGCPAAHAATAVSAESLPPLDIIVVLLPGFDTSAFFREMAGQNYPKGKIRLHLVARPGAICPRLPPELAGSAVYMPESEGSNALNGALQGLASPNLLLMLSPGSIDSQFLRGVVTALLEDSNEGWAGWELSPSLVEREEYVDPVTLEIPVSRMDMALLRRHALETVGGFNHLLPLAWQGLDAAYRLRQAGFRIRAWSPPVQYCRSAKVPRPPLIEERNQARWYMRLLYGNRLTRFCAALRLSVVSPCRARQALPHTSGAKCPGTKPSRLWRMPTEITVGGVSGRLQVPQRAPLISIIIRTHGDRMRWLRESICSVLNQAYPAVELIVVEDGGQNFKNYVESAQQTTRNRCQLRYLHQEKRGKAHAGNLGLAEARGEFIGFLDDDDLLLPNHMALLCSVLVNNPEAGAAYALAWESHTRMLPGGAYHDTYMAVGDHTRRNFDRHYLKKINYLPIQSVLFRRCLYDTHGGFDTGRRYLEDWDLWLRYSESTKFAYLPVVTSLFRTPADPYLRIARVRNIARRAVA